MKSLFSLYRGTSPSPLGSYDGLSSTSAGSSATLSGEDRDGDRFGLEGDPVLHIEKVVGSATSDLVDLCTENLTSTSLRGEISLSLQECSKLVESFVFETNAGRVSSCMSLSVSEAYSCDPMLVAASEGFFEMTGYNSAELVGTTCRCLHEDCIADPAALAAHRYACLAGTEFTGIFANRHSSGTLFLHFVDTSTLLVAKDMESGKELSFAIGLHADVTEGFADIDLDDLSIVGPTHERHVRCFAELRAHVLKVRQQLAGSKSYDDLCGALARLAPANCAPLQKVGRTEWHGCHNG